MMAKVVANLLKQKFNQDFIFLWTTTESKSASLTEDVIGRRLSLPSIISISQLRCRKESFSWQM